MILDYAATPDDVFRLKRALHRTACRHPLMGTILLGGAAIAAGGAMMACTASAVWWLLCFAGVAFAATAWYAVKVNQPTAAKVEREYAHRAWLREPFRVEIGPDGLRYEHGPFRSQAAWPALAGLVETDHHLILTERRAPGALAYGLAKRELEKTPGGTAAWRDSIRSNLARACSTQPPASFTA